VTRHPRRPVPVFVICDRFPAQMACATSAVPAIPHCRWPPQHIQQIL